MTIAEVVDGKDLVITVHTECKINYKVIDIQQSVYSMEASYGTISFKMGMMNKEKEFSSETDDPTDVFSLVLKEMINKPFLVKMTALGKITEVKNVDSLFANVFSKFPQLPEEQKQQMFTQLNQSYGEKAVASNLQLCTAVFPESSISKGDSWLIKSTLESSMSMNIETTFQLKETGDSYYILSGKGLVKNVGNNTYVKSGGTWLKYNMTGRTTSRIKIDKKTGWVLAGKLVIDVSGTAHVKESADLPDGMDVPIKVTSETIYKN